jgi:hypothetical protein
MRESNTMSSRLMLVLVAALLAAGCHGGGWVWSTDRCADIPCGAIPQPAGVYNCQWQTAQNFRAEQDKFVIYQYEWFEGGDHLGPDGRRHVETIAQRLDSVPYPVIVEKSDDAKEDEKRRQEVIAKLASLGAPDPERRVILGYSEAEGLAGTEAVRLGNRSPASPSLAPGGGGGYGATGSSFGAGTSFGAGVGGGGFGGGMGVY